MVFTVHFGFLPRNGAIVVVPHSPRFVSGVLVQRIRIANERQNERSFDRSNGALGSEEYRGGTFPVSFSTTNHSDSSAVSTPGQTCSYEISTTRQRHAQAARFNSTTGRCFRLSRLLTTRRIMATSFPRVSKQGISSSIPKYTSMGVRPPRA